MYQKYYKLLLWFTRRRVRNPDAVEDIIQETFLSAYKSKETFLEESSERTWIVGILKHKIYDYYRHVHSKYHLELELTDNVLPGTYESPEEIFNKKQKQEQLFNCIKDLKKRYRRELQHYYLEGRKTKEVGEILNISEHAVRISLHRSRIKLKTILKKVA